MMYHVLLIQVSLIGVATDLLSNSPFTFNYYAHNHVYLLV